MVRIKDDEAAAARRSLPSPEVALTPRMTYMWRHFPSYRDVIPILAYHGVNFEDNYLSVTRKRFAQQLLALKTGGFHTVTMAQYAHYVETGSTDGLPRTRSCSPSTTAASTPTAVPTRPWPGSTTPR